MKNKRDQLNHAFHSLRDDTLAEAVAAMEPPAPSKALRTRRWMTAAAACLAGILMVGAAVTIPMLRCDDSVTRPPTEPIPPVLSYYDVPLVQMMNLSYENSDEETDGEESDISMEMSDKISVEHDYVIRFDGLQEGETLTLTSRYSALSRTYFFRDIYADIDEVRDDSYYLSHKSLKKYLSYVCSMSEDVYNGQTTPFRIFKKTGDALPEVTSEPFVSGAEALCFMWKHQGINEEARKEGNVYVDYVDFIIRNAEGQITGAGCLYLANKKVMTIEEENVFFDLLSISRGQVLGSVRFDDPATVTEEQVEILLEEMRSKGEELHTTLFDESTYTADEMFIKNWATVLETSFSEHLGKENTDFIIRGNDKFAEGLRMLTIGTLGDSENYHMAFFFEDGSYAQADSLGLRCYCSDCGQINHLWNQIGQGIHRVSRDDADHETRWEIDLEEERVLWLLSEDGTYHIIDKLETEETAQSDTVE